MMLLLATAATALPMTPRGNYSSGRSWPNNPACDFMQNIVDNTGGLCTMPACDFLADHGVHIHCQVSVFSLDEIEADVRAQQQNSVKSALRAPE